MNSQEMLIKSESKKEPLILLQLFWTSTTTLQTKPKQKLASTVLFMWFTHVSEQNRTTLDLNNHLPN
jgi:hypothetical protein